MSSWPCSLDSVEGEAKAEGSVALLSDYVGWSGTLSVTGRTWMRRVRALVREGFGCNPYLPLEELGPQVRLVVELRNRILTLTSSRGLATGSRLRG